MTCEEIETGELAERYVLGQLDSDGQAAYEAHYFRCSRCFEELQLRQGMQAELSAMAAVRPAAHARQRPHAWIAWGAVAAMLAVAMGLAWWRFGSPPVTPSVAHKARLPAQTGPSLELLARVDPPSYTPPSLRGAATLDIRFRDAMAIYRQGQFAAAIPGLLAATADPKSPDPQFFLGICYLMDGRVEEAITHLRATVGPAHARAGTRCPISTLQKPCCVRKKLPAPRASWNVRLRCTATWKRRVENCSGN